MAHPVSDAGQDPDGTGQSPPAEPGPAAPPAIRASDRERDAATHRLQDAFAEGRLDDAEFDERMRTALAAHQG